MDNISKTKVSVIIPVYNVEKYLKECLDSVINQTLKEIEIICIDDGSTDNSGKILDEYAKKDVRIKVIHKENEGYGKAMNIGLDIAYKTNSEYIGIVEPDDFVDLKMYEELYNKTKENDVDIVKSNYYKYSIYSNEIKKELCCPFDKSRIYNQIITPLKHLEVFNGAPSIWSSIYRSNFLRSKHIYFLESPGASFQDTSFWIKTLIEAKQVIFIENSYVYYRTNNPKSSVKNNKKIFCICDEFEELEKWYSKENELQRKLINTLKIDKYNWNFNRLDKNGKHKFAKKIKNELELIFANKNYLENVIPNNVIISCLNNLKLNYENTILQKFPFIKKLTKIFT